MITKISLLVILVLIAFSSIFSTCKKGSITGCPNSTYSFEIDAKVYPDKDTINVGDTIWAEINSFDVFIDQQSNQQINFNSANNMSTDMGFQKLINTSPVQIQGAIPMFKFLLTSGNFIPNSNPTIEDTIILNFKIQDINNRYRFKMGIIPQDTGTYRFNFGNFVGVYRNNNPCPKADFNTIITETNQHHYLFPGGVGIPAGGSDYCFYVK